MVSNEARDCGSIMAGPSMMLTLEDRIRNLCSQAVAADDPQELNRILGELKLALREHTERLRVMVSLYPILTTDLVEPDL